MIAKLRSWWQKIIKHRAAIGVVAIVLAVVIVLIIAGYQFDWTGFSGYNKVTTTHIISGTNAGTVTRTEEYQQGKALWDWLGLLAALAIPIVVGFGAAWFTRTQQLRDQEHEKLQRERDQEAARIQHDRDQQLADQRAKSEREAAEKRAQIDRDIAQDNQQETLLQAYFDKMSELLFEKDLRKSKPGDEVSLVARVRTLTTLRRIGETRGGSIILFLYEAGLICKKDKPIIDLDGAWLYGADLYRATLYGADLSGARLSGVNLFKADLREANLSKAHLRNAKLYGADLSGADLSEARLWGAQMDKDTVLRGTKLQRAEYNKKEIQEKDAQGKLVTTRPTQWPPGFDPKAVGAICVDY